MNLNRKLSCYTEAQIIRPFYKNFIKMYLLIRNEYALVVVHSTGLPRVREKSGKNKIFSRSGNCQGILKKCQGILAISPMSGKCQGILSWQ